MPQIKKEVREYKDYLYETFQSTVNYLNALELFCKKSNVEDDTIAMRNIGLLIGKVFVNVNNINNKVISVNITDEETIGKLDDLVKAANALKDVACESNVRQRDELSGKTGYLVGVLMITCVDLISLLELKSNDE